MTRNGSQGFPARITRSDNGQLIWRMQRLEGRALLSIDNPSFEAMDLSGWQLEGDDDTVAEVVGQFGGVGPIDGAGFAVVSTTRETALRQSFEAAAGQTISGWTFFRSTNGRFARDQGRVSILDAGGEVVATAFSASSTTLGGARMTPWTLWHHTFAVSGSYTIEAVVESGGICPAPVTLGLDDVRFGSLPSAVTAMPDEFVVSGRRLEVPAPGVLANDLSAGPMRARLVTPPEVGRSISVREDGSFVYEAPLGFHGEVHFVYAVTSLGGESEAVVTLRVNPENEPPRLTQLEVERSSAREGESVRVRGVVTDHEGDEKTVTIHWGDGSSTDVTVNGDLDVFEASHAYTDEGTFEIEAIPRDTEEGMARLATVSIADVPPVLSYGGARDAAAGETYVLRLYSNDPGDDLITAWRIDWGDGSVTTVEGDPDEASHVYGSSGRFEVTASALSEGTWLAATAAGATRLDEGFGDAGTLVQHVEFSDAISRVISHGDGRFTVVGSSLMHVILRRYHGDGSIDTTFGEDGTVALLSRGTVAYDAALQEDGKILVTADTLAGTVLLRVNQDGSLDQGFGDGGIAELPNIRSAAGIAVLDDGRIVIAADVSLLKFLPDGSLDSSFGDDGIASAAGLENMRGVAVQSDGRIIAAASHRSRNETRVARFRPDGALDETFGNGGSVLVPIGAASYFDGDEGVRAVAVAPDDRIVLGGRSGAFTVVRLDRDGALDPSFGTNGVAALDSGVGSVVTDVLLLPNGKVLAAGYDGFSVVRFNADGSPDAGFGEGGLFVADLPGNLEVAHALALMEDGDVIVGGMARVNFFDFALARIEMEEAEGLTVVVE